MEFGHAHEEWRRSSSVLSTRPAGRPIHQTGAVLVHQPTARIDPSPMNLVEISLGGNNDGPPAPSGPGFDSSGLVGYVQEAEAPNDDSSDTGSVSDASAYAKKVLLQQSEHPIKGELLYQASVLPTSGSGVPALNETSKSASFGDSSHCSSQNTSSLEDYINRVAEQVPPHDGIPDSARRSSVHPLNVPPVPLLTNNKGKGRGEFQPDVIVEPPPFRLVQNEEVIGGPSVPLGAMRRRRDHGGVQKVVEDFELTRNPIHQSFSVDFNSGHPQILPGGSRPPYRNPVPAPTKQEQAPPPRMVTGNSRNPQQDLNNDFMSRPGLKRAKPHWHPVEPAGHPWPNEVVRS